MKKNPALNEARGTDSTNSQRDGGITRLSDIKRLLEPTLAEFALISITEARLLIYTAKLATRLCVCPINVQNCDFPLVFNLFHFGNIQKEEQSRHLPTVFLFPDKLLSHPATLGE